MKIIITTLAICLLSWGCKKHNSGGPIITTVAGNGDIKDFPTDGAMATDCNIAAHNVAADHNGNFYFSDGTSIYKVSMDGRLHRFAGKQADSGFSGDNGPALEAQMGRVSYMKFDKNGNLFLVDPENQRVRKVDVYGIISTIAGNGIKGYSGDGGQATNAQLNSPDGVAIDNSGNVYISDGWNYRIRKVDPNGIISTMAGTGVGGFEGDGGPATVAKIYGSYGLGVDDAGNIYMFSGIRIRKISSNGMITTVAGNGTEGFTGDGGPATAAEIQGGGMANPTPYSIVQSGIAVDREGNIFFPDGYHQRIRRIDRNGIISTFAGDGTYWGQQGWVIGGFSGDGGPAIAAKLYWPADVAVDDQGNIFIADAYNYRIRKVTR